MAALSDGGTRHNDLKRQKCSSVVSERDSKGVFSGATSSAATPAMAAGLYIPDALAQAASRFNQPAPYTASGALANESKISYQKTLCVRNLPEWVTAPELKGLFTRLSAAGLETLFTVSHQNQQIITNIHIARDPETQKCTGYAFVEFTEHAVAAEMLATLPGPHFCFPGTTKQLTLEWAQAPIAPSSILDNYHFYIGNLRPRLADRAVLEVLRTLHPAVVSVMLIPQEVLGLAPPYIEDPTIPEDDLENKQTQVCIAAAFYCAASHPTQPQKLAPLPKRPGESQWGAGFVRLADDAVHDWKAILRILRAKLSSEAGHILRRTPFTPSATLASPDHPHPSIAIVLRPIFGLFDHTTSIGYRYTGSGFPTTGGKKSQPTGGAFPQPSPLLAGTPFAQSAKREDDSPYGPQNKTSLYISNLSDDTTDHDMTSLLAPFGVVLSSRVAFLKHAAFLELGDHRSVLAALSHLRGCVFKKNKLQLEWGRARPLQAPALRAAETQSATEREAQLLEKAFARERMQAMQPQLRKEELCVPSAPLPGHNRQASTKEPQTPEERAFWLGTLCASLPSPPSSSGQPQATTHSVTSSETEQHGGAAAAQ